MELDLETAARISRDAAIGAVHAAMDARRRGSPWDVSEAFLKISIFQALSEHIGTSPVESHLRLFDELKVSDIANLKQNPAVHGYAESHPVDLTVVYPISDRNDDLEVWESYPAYGLIEIKKNFKRVQDDATWLSELATHVFKVSQQDGNRGASSFAKSNRAMRWVLFVVFVNGNDKNDSNDIKTRVEDCSKAIHAHGLELIIGGNTPQKTKLLNVPMGGDYLFDILCFGKNVRD